MSDGPTQLELRIARFEELLEEMKEATREAHSSLGEMKRTKREIDQRLSTDVKKMVEDEVSRVVKTTLDEIGPQIRAQTNLIYDRVGKEIDKLIDLSMGKEFAAFHGREDLRPALAAKLRVWIREVIGGN